MTAAEPAFSASEQSPEASGFSKLAETDVHNGKVIRLVEAVFAAPDGHRVRRDVVRHMGAVAVVAVDGDEVVLVRQFRAPIGRDLLEIPAGKRDVRDEPPAETARRELAEEAGLECESLEELCSFYNSPGFCDELSHLYLATALRAVPTRRDGVEEQWMTVERVKLNDVMPMIERGEICDAKTVIGLLLALRRLSR